MGAKFDGRQLHHLRFADDIVLITPGISQAERMLADFDRVCGNTAAESYEDDVHEERTTPLSGPGSQHGQRPRPRAGQEETSDLGSLQERRINREEDEERPDPCPLLPETWAIREQDEHAINVA
ncbi:unnamed protein product [Heligmosomoides polygyrus]|uniref:Reverse transcriptase domain-containing protein n=1 Tax=Heligmosomoides polygyrus TaxID=6339 RepID=A0A183FDM7_HELPZ|nr:unnamed protein product [Heligmosomoides polygyrus]